MPGLPRSGFIGCGRLARTLAQALARAGFPVVAAWNRTPAALRVLGDEVPAARACASPQEVVDACDLAWITVADDAIGPVCDGLVWTARHAVVHCSGATEVGVLAQAARAGAAIGGFHPLQMFANPAVALAGLPGCTVGIEADAPLHDLLDAVARAISCVPIRVPPGQRALYHASAYYTGPFLIALLAEAAALWRQFGASEAQALAALLPLLRGTVSAVATAGTSVMQSRCARAGCGGPCSRSSG